VLGSVRKQESENIHAYNLQSSVAASPSPVAAFPFHAVTWTQRRSYRRRREKLKVNSVQEQAGAKAQHQDDDSGSVESNCAFVSWRGSSASKVCQPQLSQVSRDSRVSAGGFTRADRTVGADFQPSYLAAVYGASVVSTRSGSRPRVNVSLTDHYGHAVPSFNIFHGLPSNSDFYKRVGDSNSFIKESDLRTDKNKVSQARYGRSPSDTGQRAVQILFKDELDNQSSAHKKNDARKNITAPRPKDFRVMHSAILSCRPNFDYCDIEGSRP
jgi:hypothetical protein